MMFPVSAYSDVMKHCSEITVAGAEQWVPFAYNQMQNGKLQAKGISYDVIQLVGDELGVMVKRKVGMPWKRIELALEQGTVDVLAGNYWSESRAQKWRLTRAIAHEPVKLLTTENGQFQFNHFRDLQGRTGVVPRGISLGRDFDQAWTYLNIIEVKTHEQMYEMLNRGRVDYLVSPEFAAKKQLKKAENGNIVFLDKEVNIYSVHLSFSRHSPCTPLFEKFDQVIAKKLADGSIDRILAGYQLK